MINKLIVKEIINFILVIVFTFLYVYYISTIINEIFNSRLISIGLWGVIIGIWGNLVGMRIVKPLFIFKNYKKENYIYVIIGCLLIFAGFVFHK